MLLCTCNVLRNVATFIELHGMLSLTAMFWIYGNMCVRADSLLKSNAETNIPRDAVRIMSGFSEEVAIAVTQPLWPAREPR